MSTVKTVLSLLVQIEKLQEQKAILVREMEKNVFHNEIIEIANSFGGGQSDAEKLAFAISERDWPMTQSEIEEVFRSSGFLYCQDHILAAMPDQDETTLEFRKNEAADYASVYGNGDEF